MKFNKNFETDYDFYLNSINIFNTLGYKICKNIFDANGFSAKECFYHLDSSGKILPCNDLDLLKKLLNCKASVNLQIKMWAEGVADFTLNAHEILEYCEYYNCPSWCFKAVMNQASSIMREFSIKKKKDNFQSVLILSASI